jgi:hypothetical protein
MPTLAGEPFHGAGSDYMNRQEILHRRIRVMTWLFILGLFVSGATAIPLVAEVDALVSLTGAGQLVNHPGATDSPAWAHWLTRVDAALHETEQRSPLLFYGTDWLAFGHFVIAVAFVGALRDPVRNRWLFSFGLIACGLVIPYALLFGAIRGIPFWWRVIDCSFGLFGMIPLWLCRHWVAELEGGSGQFR